MPTSLIAAWALALVLAGTLAGDILAVDAAAWVAEAALVTYLAASWPGLAFKGRAFLLVSLALLPVLWIMAEAPTADLLTALDRAAFVASLFTALGFLKDAAQTSGMVRRCGAFLASQPPGRRYLALTGGGHLFGLMLNYGSIALLGTMAERATAGEPDPLVRRARLKRMLLAVQRGFIGTLSWSPLTICLAVTLTALPGTPWIEILPVLVVDTLLVLGIGWAMDSLFKPRLARPPAPRATIGTWHRMVPMVALVGLVFAASIGLSTTLDTQLIIAVMLAVPVIGAAWLFGQYWCEAPRAAPALLGRRLRRHAADLFPAYGMEVAVLSSAAFIGTVLAAVLPMDRVAPLLDALNVPGWSMAVGALWLVVALGQLGMNPILSVTILSAAFPDPASLGLSPAVLAVAFTGGWTLAGATSPFTATTMLVGRIAAVEAGTVGRAWNGLYTLVTGSVLSGWIVVLAVFA